MKNFVLIFLLICSQYSFTQVNISEEEKIRDLIRVWGLLKYQHPEVSSGKYDFNAEFIDQLEKFENTGTRQDFNSQLLDWIKSFGTDDLKPHKERKKREELFSKNADFKWIENSGFGTELKGLLQKIQNNTNYKDHYASVNRFSSSVEFDNDGPMEHFDANNKAHRLLFLSHFWNAMKYWNVNIYLTETPWSQVLPEMIPDFSNEDPAAFEPAKEKLFSKLNDSHSNYYPSVTLNSFTRFPNFGGRIINDSLVVTRIFNEKLTKEDGISVGDVIYSVEGTGLKTYYTEKFSEVISTSTDNYLKRAIENNYLLASDEDSIRVGIFRKNGKSEEQYIMLKELDYPYQKYERMHPEETDQWRFLGDEVGYLNLYKITKKELKSAFEAFENTKGIVVDLRNYPRHLSASHLPKYLYPSRKKFIKVLTPALPAYGKPDTKAALRLVMDPFAAGRRKRKNYKGKVVLLVDRSTASMAEWMGMAIQEGPNTVTVGEQTFGAFMNRNEIPLMDKTTIDFTGAGAFYPNGDHAQRRGLKIDVEVQESAKNYEKDLYLEKAKDVIEKSKEHDDADL